MKYAIDPFNRVTVAQLCQTDRMTATEVARHSGVTARAVDRDSLVYLATPYTHKDWHVRQSRYHAANFCAAFLMGKLGLHVFSPISHSVPIAEDGSLPTSWKFWKEYDEAILRVCKRVVVLTQDGWKESEGVTAELEIAKDLGLPIAYISPEMVERLAEALPDIH